MKLVDSGASRLNRPGRIVFGASCPDTATPSDNNNILLGLKIRFNSIFSKTTTKSLKNKLK